MRDLHHIIMIIKQDWGNYLAYYYTHLMFYPLQQYVYHEASGDDRHNMLDIIASPQ